MRDELISQVIWVAIVLRAAILLLAVSCAGSPRGQPPATPASAATLAGGGSTPTSTGTAPSPTVQAPLKPGQPGDGPSTGASLSADGRFVAFASAAANLVPEDSADIWDIFVHDRQTGRTERISIAPDGTGADGDSHDPAISADGRYVAFWSWAGNLVPGDDNGEADVFLRDRWTGETTLVSVGPGGKPARGGEGVGSYYPSLSADGRFVAFVSWASNLVPGDTNRLPDGFVYDRERHTITRLCISIDGVEASASTDLAQISADGRWVALMCSATDVDLGGLPGAPAPVQIYLRNQQTADAQAVSVSADGSPGDRASGAPGVSGDGRWVAYASWASDLAPGGSPGWASIFLRDCRAARTEWVADYTRAPGATLQSRAVSLSWDGRWLAFDSDADDLVPGDTNGERDVFVYDRDTRHVERASVAADGAQAIGGSSGWPSISGDGRYVAFTSRATNLVPGIGAPESHVYVRDRQTGDIELVSCSSR